VKTLKVGDFVVGSFVISDNTCELCQAGYPSMCVHAAFVAQTIGTQSDKARIPYADGTLVATPGQPDPDLVPSLLAASDVLGTGWFGAVAAEAGPGKTVAVVGDGAVGLMAILAAKQLGEVAMLAGVSLDYYTRLERGNLRGASESVLHAIARALQLNDVEREYLFGLARTAPVSSAARSRKPATRSVRASVQRVLDNLAVPAVVFNAQQDLIASNLMGGRCSRPTSRPRSRTWPGSSSLPPRQGLLRRLAPGASHDRLDAATRSRPRPPQQRPHRNHRGTINPRPAVQEGLG
jgi:Zn-dependent alcohol dehydrogenase